jgi:outer membrane protein assembly factor BamA
LASVSNRLTVQQYAIDKVRLTDRFFLGEPQLRGFDIRGVGPRVIREYGSVQRDWLHIQRTKGR